MSSEEDQEVFEITDFTTASDWERFIARIEEVIHEWKLPQRSAVPPLKKDELTTGEWIERREQLMFASFQFEAVHHMLLTPTDATHSNEEAGEPYCLADMMSRENDFPPKAHCLVRWYGLREFVVIHPAKASDSILTEDRARMLLSSVCIAINNTNCQVPVFVQLQQMRQKFFLGVCEGGTSFDMVHLHRPFPHYAHLAGLLQLFKDKMMQCIGAPCPEPVSVAVRFTYVLQDWSPFSWPQPPPEIDELGEDITPTDIGRLPCGALEDPVLEFHLSVTWPHLSEMSVVDNDVHSDLNPILSPKWSMRLKTSDKPSCSMADYLRAFHNLAQSFYSESPLLGNGASDELDTDGGGGGNITHALDRLAGPAGGGQRGRSQQPQQSPPVIGEEVLIRILQYIFPDSAPHHNSSDSDEWKDSFSDGPASPKIQEQLRSVKSAPPDSLTWRLALAVCHAAHCFGSLPAVAQLWRDFLLEMRHRWENNYTLPCLEPGTPNMNHCLLHQKLQMLNCCIERKKSREWLAVQPVAPSSDSEEEDQFFECPETASLSSLSGTNANKKPEGRLRQLGDSRLLRSDEPLYIPCTQEPAPVTEDALAAQAEALERLGTHAEGAALRARMQAACLHSDMEAFKAANPRGCLEDFVRWYSPRDLVEEKDSDGNVSWVLSARMKLPGNMWLEAWEAARPTPARRQKRLFDDTKEAEKVLHFLTSVKTSEVVLHLMPILVHCAILQLAEQEDVPRSLPLKLEETTLKVAKVSRSSEPKYEGVLRCLHEAECVWACLSSVRTKLMGEEGGKEVGAFALSLLDMEEAEVPGGAQGPVGKRIRQLFAEANKVSQQGEDSPSEFPPPCGKEFILRCAPKRPLGGPHRMYAVLTRDEFRLAGAFTQDTTFL